MLVVCPRKKLDSEFDTITPILCTDEIPLGPLPPLAAVDQLMHAREIITYVASMNGYRATLYPKPYVEGPGTGLHMHLSFPAALSIGSSFFAGILQALPTICAFSLAGEDSYLRVDDGAWSGGTWCIWGDNNREANLRRLEKEKNHWELKCLDGFANVYLAVAAVLHAGRLGVQGNMQLPEPCNGVSILGAISCGQCAELYIW